MVWVVGMFGRGNSCDDERQHGLKVRDHLVNDHNIVVGVPEHDGVCAVEAGWLITFRMIAVQSLGAWHTCSTQLISVQRPPAPAPLAVFSRFLRGSAAGASGFLSPKLPKMG